MKFQNLRLFPGHLSKNHVSHIIVLPNDIEYIQAFERVLHLHFKSHCKPTSTYSHYNSSIFTFFEVLIMFCLLIRSIFGASLLFSVFQLGLTKRRPWEESQGWEETVILSIYILFHPMIWKQLHSSSYGQSS